METQGIYTTKEVIDMIYSYTQTWNEENPSDINPLIAHALFSVYMCGWEGAIKEVKETLNTL